MCGAMADLLPGENLIVKLHQHWIFVVKSVLIPIALLVLVLSGNLILHANREIRVLAFGTEIFEG